MQKTGGGPDDRWGLWGGFGIVAGGVVGVSFSSRCLSWCMHFCLNGCS